MWEPAVSGMEKAHNCADLSYRRIRRYSVGRLKRLEACDFSHVRFTNYAINTFTELIKRKDSARIIKSCTLKITH